MNTFSLYSWNETIALLVSVAFGTGAYIAFVKQQETKKVNITFIITVVTINIFVTYLVSQFIILKTSQLGIYRNIILPLVAFSGQYIMDWWHRRAGRIFDAIVGKAIGKEIGDENTNNNEEYTENHYKE